MTPASDEFEFVLRPERLDGEVFWLLFHNQRVILLDQQGDLQIPRDRIHHFFSAEPLPEHYLGRLNGVHCLAVEVPETAILPDEYQGYDLRQLLGIFDESWFMLASRAAQVLTWYRNHQYCSRCGSATEMHDSDRARICHACQYIQYPRITPCVIMLVENDDRILLAHSVKFKTPMFSCLAGFMEAGETAEQAVCREVYEETGLRIHNLRYHGSQSWPFPHSLMLGFSAEYLAGEIRLEYEELTEADWFSANNLPLIPPPGSIARSLIDAWLDKRRL